MSGIIRNKVLLRAFLASAFFVFAPMGVAHGQTWSTQTSVVGGLLDVSFADSSTGWAVGNGGGIFSTTNGGSTWTAQTSGTTNQLIGVFSVDSSTGWAVGVLGTIRTTANGGTTWTSQTSGTTEALNDIFFVNSSTGWAVGSNGTILKTTNGGTTWTAQDSEIVDELNDIFFVNSSTGWAVGALGTILITANGGTTWTAQTSGTDERLDGGYFTDSSTGWAAGNNGTILKTTNGGSTWTAQTSGTARALQDVFFVDSSTGWAVGDAGTIRATTNGGSTWTAQTSGTAQLLYGVYFTDSSTGWAVGDSGDILKFTGASSPSSSNPRRPSSFEEQRQLLASRLAPNAPRDARVVPLPCRNDNCPVEIEFVYAPLELHRGRAASFVFYDDAGRKAASLPATPALASREYRLSLRLNGGNSAVSGKICAVVGTQESCAPVQGFADIALDQNAIAWSDELLDVAREEYRLSFRTAKLPINHAVGKTGATIGVYEDNDVRRVVMERFFAFFSRTQVLVPTIRAGNYIVRVIPQNAEGKAGVAVEQRITVPLSRVAEKAAPETRVGDGRTVEEIFTRIRSLLQAIIAQFQRR